MFAIGSGLIYTSVIINAWCYFPRAKGAILGLILTGFGCSGFTMTIVLNRTVNPLKKEVNGVNGYYDKDIAIQSLMYVKYMLVVMIVGSVVAVMLMNPWRKQFEVEEKEDDVVYDTTNQHVNEGETYNELVNHCNSNNEYIRTTTEYVNCNQNISLCLRSKPFYQLISVYFLSSLFNISTKLSIYKRAVVWNAGILHQKYLPRTKFWEKFRDTRQQLGGIVLHNPSQW